MATEEQVLNAAEEVKRSSEHLRGNLAEELAGPAPSVSGDSEQLLKFHGIYSQDDRDLRRERAQARQPLEYIYMIRVAIPGGHLTPDQWIALDDVADELTDGTIRLTTRQAVQFHGVRKGALRPLAQALDAHLMTSFGACGDVVRNIVTCPALQTNDPDGPLSRMTEHLARTFKPATQAHWELFVDGEKASSKETVEHDFYGETYLPRKFKIAIANPMDNCVDVFAQDIGLIPGTHPEAGEGFSVVVGGGLGRNYVNLDTFARLGDVLAFATYDEIDDLIRAILMTFKDLGDRSDRRRARMKYLVADRGLDAFRSEVEERYGRRLRTPLNDVAPFVADDHLGWTTLPDGTLQLGIRVGAGRVRDTDGGVRLKRALRIIAETYPVHFHVTAQQDIVIAYIPVDARQAIDDLLADHGVRAVDELGPVERSALACPALPTCGQALAESERVLPEVVDLLEGALAERGLSGRRLQLRMTGCPNGCARPAVAEIGVVGHTKSGYDIYLGGGLRGDRLAALHKEKVKLADLPSVVGPLLDRWRDEALPDEPFGDFYTRVSNS